MDRKFTLSCCSTVDLPYSYMESRDIPVLFYTYVVDGVEYDDDMGRDPEALPRFYRFLEEGKLPQTSQINVAAYMDFFEKLLQKGDLLHIAFTSGQSGSVHNAFLAAEELRQKYPDRKLIVIDSLCSSSGYGLLVDSAADMRDAGRSIDEAGRHRLHQGVQQGTGQEEGCGDHGGYHGAVRPGRAGLRRQVLCVPLTVSRGCPDAHRRHRGAVPQAEGKGAAVRHRHHHRLPRGAGDCGGVLLRQ